MFRGWHSRCLVTIVRHHKMPAPSLDVDIGCRSSFSLARPHHSKPPFSFLLPFPVIGGEASWCPTGQSVMSVSELSVTPAHSPLSLCPGSDVLGSLLSVYFSPLIGSLTSCLFFLFDMVSSGRSATYFPHMSLPLQLRVAITFQGEQRAHYRGGGVGVALDSLPALCRHECSYFFWA